MYPKKWPGKVMLTVGGKKFEHEVLSPRGDVDQPMTWEDAEQKLKRLGRPFFDTARIMKLGDLVKGLNGMKKVDDLLHFLHGG